MQYSKILKYFLVALFIGTFSFTISDAAFAKNETLTIIKETFIENTAVVSDSISKSEIADYRKNFEAVEKQISAKRGTYESAKSSFDGIKNSRVRNLPEFAGRFSSMQSKLTAWNLEVNPKLPPVKEPVNPKNPKNPTKTNNGQAEEEKNVNENLRKSVMLSYFPDTMSVGTDFLAYIEISKDNMMKFGNMNNNNNSGIDSIVISSSAVRTAVMNTQVTVELSKDGGADNFSINSRDSKMKTISDNGSARWEWLLSPNAAGDGRLRLSVSYQKQNKDGSMQEVAAMNKVIVVKGLAKKNADTASNSLMWIILGVVVVLVIIVFVLLNGRKKNKYDRDNRNDRQNMDRQNMDRDRQNRNDRNDVDRDTRL